MNHISDNFVAIVAILAVFGMPLGYAMINRVYAHRERIEMIRRGMTPPPDQRWAKQFARRGAFYDPYGMSPDRMLRKGITIAMIGFALCIGLSFIGQGPWLLGGLIPLFVGIAQVIIALMSGAHFGGWTMMTPPPIEHGSTPGSPPPEGPYAWRPGPTTELEPPAGPPDKRQW